jgi:uncharacterized membrane protein YfcA
LLIASVPTAFVGGFIVLDEHIYNTLTGIALLCAAIILVTRRSDGIPERLAPPIGVLAIGTGVGFVSGLTGIGGGVFLAPLLIVLRWASPKQTAALSSPFILANSVVGLIGAQLAGQQPSSQTWLYAIAALIGAMIGVIVGLRWLSQSLTRYALALLLGSAGVQLLALPSLLAAFA